MHPPRPAVGAQQACTHQKDCVQLPHQPIAPPQAQARLKTGGVWGLGFEAEVSCFSFDSSADRQDG